MNNHVERLVVSALETARWNLEIIKKERDRAQYHLEEKQEELDALTQKINSFLLFLESSDNASN